MKNSLLGWFEKRRKSKILQIAQKQISQTIEIVSGLNIAVTALSEGKKKEAEKRLEQLFLEEIEINDQRKKILEELTKGELPSKYREDLKDLVEHLDVLVDYVKDSARCLKILMKSEIPKEVLDQCVEMSKNLMDCATILQDGIQMLGVDVAQAQFVDRIDALENRVDEEYFKIMLLNLQYAKQMDNYTLMILKDFTQFMERVADRCADAADCVRVLAS